MQPLTRPITFANHSSLRSSCACLWPEMLMHKCHGTRVPVSTRYKNGRSSAIDDWSWAWSIDLLLFSSEDKTYLLQLTYRVAAALFVYPTSTYVYLSAYSRNVRAYLSVCSVGCCLVLCAKSLSWSRIPYWILQIQSSRNSDGCWKRMSAFS